METKYILIKKLNPFESESSNRLLKPEKDKSIFVIKLTSAIRPEPQGESILLNDKYHIEILDKSENKSGININHLCITQIEYDCNTHEITFSINEGQKVISQRVGFIRTNPEIRIDIINAIKKISLISTSIATITKL